MVRNDGGAPTIHKIDDVANIDLNDPTIEKIEPEQILRHIRSIETRLTADEVRDDVMNSPMPMSASPYSPNRLERQISPSLGIVPEDTSSLDDSHLQKVPSLHAIAEEEQEPVEPHTRLSATSIRLAQEASRETVVAPSGETTELTNADEPDKWREDSVRLHTLVDDGAAHHVAAIPTSVTDAREEDHAPDNAQTKDEAPEKSVQLGIVPDLSQVNVSAEPPSALPHDESADMIKAAAHPLSTKEIAARDGTVDDDTTLHGGDMPAGRPIADGEKPTTEGAGHEKQVALDNPAADTTYAVGDAQKAPSEDKVLEDTQLEPIAPKAEDPVPESVAAVLVATEIAPIGAEKVADTTADVTETPSSTLSDPRGQVMTAAADASQTASSAMSNTKDKAVENVSQAAEAASSAKGRVANKFASATGAASSTISDAKDKAADTAASAKNTVADSVAGAVDTASSTLNNAKYQAADAASKAADSASRSLSDSKGAASEAANTASSTLSAAKDTVITTAVDTKNTVADSSAGALDTASSTLSNTKDKAAEVAVDAKDKVAGTASVVAGKPTSTLSDSKDKAANTTAAVAGTASSVFNDAKDKTTNTAAAVQDKVADTVEKTVARAVDAKDQAVDTAAKASETASSTLNDAKGQTVTTAVDAKDRVADAASKAAVTATSYAVDAKDIVADTASSAANTASSTLTDAKDNAVATSAAAAETSKSALNDAKDKATDTNAAAADTARTSLSKAKDATVETSAAAVDTVSSTLTNARDQAADTAAAVTAAASSTKDQVVDTAAAAADTASSALTDAKDAVVDTAASAAETAGSTLSDAKDQVVDTASKAVGTASSTLADAKEAVVGTAADTAESASKALSDTKEKAANTAGHAAETTSSTLDDVTNKASASAAQAAEMASSSADAAKDNAAGVAGEAIETAKYTKDTAVENVAQAAETASSNLTNVKDKISASVAETVPEPLKEAVGATTDAAAEMNRQAAKSKDDSAPPLFNDVKPKKHETNPQVDGSVPGDDVDVSQLAAAPTFGQKSEPFVLVPLQDTPESNEQPEQVVPAESNTSKAPESAFLSLAPTGTNTSDSATKDPEASTIEATQIEPLKEQRPVNTEPVKEDEMPIVEDTKIEPLREEKVQSSEPTEPSSSKKGLQPAAEAVLNSLYTPEAAAVGLASGAAGAALLSRMGVERMDSRQRAAATVDAILSDPEVVAPTSVVHEVEVRDVSKEHPIDDSTRAAVASEFGTHETSTQHGADFPKYDAEQPGTVGEGTFTAAGGDVPAESEHQTEENEHTVAADQPTSSHFEFVAVVPASTEEPQRVVPQESNTAEVPDSDFLTLVPRTAEEASRENVDDDTDGDGEGHNDTQPLLSKGAKTYGGTDLAKSTSAEATANSEDNAHLRSRAHGTATGGGAIERSVTPASMHRDLRPKQPQNFLMAFFRTVFVDWLGGLWRGLFGEGRSS
jgi:hypothetical protein